MSKHLVLLQELRSEIEDLNFRYEENLDALRRRTEMLARKIFGDNSHYLEDLAKKSDFIQ